MFPDLTALGVVTILIYKVDDIYIYMLYLLFGRLCRLLLLFYALGNGDAMCFVSVCLLLSSHYYYVLLLHAAMIGQEVYAIKEDRLAIMAGNLCVLKIQRYRMIYLVYIAV